MKKMVITPEDEARVSKRDLVRLVAHRAGVGIVITNRVYEALLAEIIEQVRAGRQVNLSGFGHYKGQLHKGAPAQFGAAGQTLPDYTVLKFSAARTLSDFLALDDEAIRGRLVPGTTLSLAPASPVETTDGGEL